MLEKFASLVTDKIIAASESEKKEIISKGIIRASKIITISSGIDINLKSTMGKNYIREIIKIPSACKIILSVGRLSPQKDPITFFRAANIIKNIYPQWYFVWIGDGELKEDIDNYIQCNNLEGRCFILGWRTDYNDLIASADIFVLTSTYESFGYVTCNALLNEIPTIGTNVTGTKDIIEHEVSGYLVNAKDYKKIAELIIKLLNDDSLRAKFIKNGYQRIITHFDVREMVINTELFYKSLLA
jgi:glycosyltransferase involved in cell wall biosynthesis